VDTTGHIKSDCPKKKGQSKEKEKNTESNPKSKCERCGKVGHLTETCWKDPKNESKRPQWLKDKMKKNTSGRDGTEVANTHVDVSNSKPSIGGTYEFLCSSVTTPKDQ
jgi:hypothetical protein